MAAKQQIKVPDVGGAIDVDVIEVLVTVGDRIEENDSLITLESEKASMEVPSPLTGVVEVIHVSVGDKVSEGSLIVTVSSDEKTSTAKPTAEKVDKPTQKSKQQTVPETSAEKPQTTIPKGEDDLYASPIVRRLAREFDIDLKQVPATGRKGRISKQDIQTYVKQRLAIAEGRVASGPAPAPAIDFSKFGDIETKPLNKIKRLTGVHVHRSWSSIPHVTHFDEVDVTELEETRRKKQQETVKQGYKLTILTFIMKAVVKALQHYPQFNASLAADGEQLVYKKYFHIGIAVDTPNGLVVPVIRDVDAKDVIQLAKELAATSEKAREKGLTPQEMQGNCITISSLGGIGGTAFTPIVNMPDVAILGVARARIQAVYQQDKFIPRLMLPLALSYDHRVIDGAEAARFMRMIVEELSSPSGMMSTSKKLGS